MNVQGIRAVVEVSRGTVLAEKVISVKLEAASDTGVELGCPDAPGDRPQRAQVVSRVEVVNPSL
jgi:hypothetical protein